MLAFHLFTAKADGPFDTSAFLLQYLIYIYFSYQDDPTVGSST